MIELGDKIGKVQKGFTEEQIIRIPKKKILKTNDGNGNSLK